MNLSEKFPHDINGWLIEKIETVIIELIHLMKTLKGNIPNKNLFDNYPYNDPYYGTIPKEVFNSIYGMLFDITKIYSFSLGSEWESSDRNIILNDLNEGFEKLQKKYGLIKNTKKEEAESNVKKFIVELKGLLNGDIYPNRQLINNLFDAYKDFIYSNNYYTHIFKNMERILDDVNLGYIEWYEYLDKMENILENIEEKMDAYKKMNRTECFTEENISIKKSSLSKWE